MPCVYILYSPATQRFYTGYTTVSVALRMDRHLTNYYQAKFTSSAKDWQLFLTIDCITEKQARNIETQIKRMKSRVYIENLKKYPEMTEKLLARFA